MKLSFRELSLTWRGRVLQILVWTREDSEEQGCISRWKYPKTTAFRISPSVSSDPTDGEGIKLDLFAQDLSLLVLLKCVLIWFSVAGLGSGKSFGVDLGWFLEREVFVLFSEGQPRNTLFFERA